MQTGVDLVDVADVEHSLTAFGERYARRVHRPDELERTVAPHDRRYATDLAQGFAAKEAVFKALRMPSSATLPWHDIEICLDRVPRPGVVLHDHALDWARTTGISRVELTVSNSDGTAIAVAVAH